MLKASGKMGVPQGGVLSPLLSNLYLNEVDRMLERAREVTRNGKYTYIEYARFADDLVVWHRQVSRERAWWSRVGQVNGQDDDASRPNLRRLSIPC